jgi:hypothetical protein
MTQGLRPAGWLLAGSVGLIALTCGAAFANVGSVPRVEVSCLRSETVLKADPEALAEAEPGERIPLNRVTICKQSRRVCFAYREEVPMSRCIAAH